LSRVHSVLRNNLLEHLQHNRQVASLRLAQQQMRVLGHNDKSSQVESVPTTYSFQRDNESVARQTASKQRRAAVTTERNEMKVTSLLISLKSPGHEIEITSWCQVSAVTDEHWHDQKHKAHKSCGRWGLKAPPPRKEREEGRAPVFGVVKAWASPPGSAPTPGWFARGEILRAFSAAFRPPFSVAVASLHLYLLIRYSWRYPTETSKVRSQHRLRREPKERLEFVAPRASSVCQQ
jgi:hypothetical protein